MCTCVLVCDCVCVLYFLCLLSMFWVGVVTSAPAARAFLRMMAWCSIVGIVSLNFLDLASVLHSLQSLWQPLFGSFADTVSCLLVGVARSCVSWEMLPPIVSPFGRWSLSTLVCAWKRTWR